MWMRRITDQDNPPFLRGPSRKRITPQELPINQTLGRNVLADIFENRSQGVRGSEKLVRVATE